MIPSALLWRADSNPCSSKAGATSEGEAWSTGFAELDAELPHGGWPSAELVELLTPPGPATGDARRRELPATVQAGPEWSLLSPALARRHGLDGLAGNAARPDRPEEDDARPVLCVSPPHPPYAPALERLGLAPHRLLRVLAESAKDAAWAAEQGARAQACSAVIWWVGAHIPDGALHVALRRLQLAAQAGRTPIFAVRSQQARSLPSAAPLRLSIESADRGMLALTVIKQRGASRQSPILLLPRNLPPSIQKKMCAPTPELEFTLKTGKAPRPAPQAHAVVGPAPESLAA